MSLNQRLRRDARRLAGDPEAAALFECLVEHIFDPAFDNAFIARKSGAPRTVRDRLAAIIGPLGKYVTERRMAEAERLVRETRLTIAEIAKRLGYPRRRTFRRAFGTAHGMSAREMRRQARSGDAGKADDATADDGVAPAPEPDERHDGDRKGNGSIAGKADAGLSQRALAARMLRQRELGMLEPQLAAELRLELRRRHPRLDQMDDEPQPGEALELEDLHAGGTPAPQTAERDLLASGDAGPARLPAVLTPTGDRLEEVAADAAFSALLDLPPEGQRFALLQGLQLGNVTAFQHLFRFSLERLYLDVDRSLRIARLGVELVETHRVQMGDEGDHWQAMAWVGLGKVQLFAGEFGEADQSLAFAAAEVGGEDRLPPWVEIELRGVEGLIRRSQRRDAEAAQAFDRALELGRALDPGDPKRPESVLQRLELASNLADGETGMTLIDELEFLIGADPEAVPWGHLWHGLIDFHRARAYTALDLDYAAEGTLRQALKRIRTKPADSSDAELGVLATFILYQLARLISRDARRAEGEPDRLPEVESLLRLTLERYRLLDLPVLAAATEAELAAVCALRGRREEARQLATAAADFLDQLPPLHREALQAARRLRALANGGAAASEDELRQLLSQLQHDLNRVTWEITDPRAAAAARAREARARGGARGSPRQ